MSFSRAVPRRRRLVALSASAVLSFALFAQSGSPVPPPSTAALPAAAPPAVVPPAPIVPPAAIALLPDIDPAIARLLLSTAAYDNHAHTVLPPPADTTDRGFDALPVDSMVPQTDPVALRDDSYALPAAWQALWNVTLPSPLTPASTVQLNTARAATRRQHAADYSTWVIAQAGIATQVSNRVSMGPGLAAPHFRWVPYADALLFPLSNTGLAARNPDRGAFFPLEDRLRATYLQQLNLPAVPTTLDAYLQQVVLPLLRQQRANGAIAEKFEIAYLRPFGFADVSHDEAAAIYAAQIGRPAPDEAAYARLQDFLFRTIALESGRLGMAVHLHTSAGSGSYFDIAGVDPLRLEPLFNDPRLRGTTFVLLHGGFPQTGAATALLQKPNVYLDLSQEALIYSPRTFAATLRERLELYPDKVLFGTDGYPYTASLGWEESTWIAARNTRTALGIALSGMLRDGDIDRPRAEKLAHMVLYDNAAALYNK